MRNILVLLVLLGSAVCSFAQSKSDTVVYVYTSGDTVVLNQQITGIFVRTSVSSNGDGGFCRYVSLSFDVPSDLCAGINTSEIEKIELKMNELDYVFREFENTGMPCRFLMAYRDNGTHWSSMRYRLGYDNP